MENIPRLILLVLFGGTGLIAIFTITNLLLPVLVDHARDVLEYSLIRSLLLGLVNFLFASLVVALLSLPTHGGGILAGIFVFLIGLVLLAVTGLLLLGLAGVISLLESHMGEAKSTLASHLRAGLLLVLACLTPYLGWFVITPLVVWTALGASIQLIFRKRAVATPARFTKPNA